MYMHIYLITNYCHSGRSLVWSRISAFQAGDAGSNPADRIIIYWYECVQLQAEVRVLVKEVRRG